MYLFKLALQVTKTVKIGCRFRFYQVVFTLSHSPSLKKICFTDEELETKGAKHMKVRFPATVT